MAAPITTDAWLAFEDGWLAPYAMPSRASRGRKHTEPEHEYRSLYQRDRERIVHCTAFRRMTGKTQVLVASVNDHHRTRLTHTLEVTQLARTVARRLRLNEDLAEAIALAHDIGHPPFGHAGEDALDECLKPFGGFDHNLFGLRRVDELEERYPQFPGLNLSFEVREAFVQHSSRRDAPSAPSSGRPGRRCSKPRSPTSWTPSPTTRTTRMMHSGWGSSRSTNCAASSSGRARRSACRYTRRGCPKGRCAWP
ncbi:dGTP triphosphohydrolase [Gemmata sp. SH-PL17]|uniref:dGTP triphosphohydrolase n=1 Tax=Gemmata sp. SH-PL17 TaxID=1630693 RepID=UPI001EF4C1CA|nr:dNTP triphosphohydrolase [Gemmata sp. SH-PL17]